VKSKKDNLVKHYMDMAHGQNPPVPGKIRRSSTGLDVFRLFSILILVGHDDVDEQEQCLELMSS
jgi:hypothetical protein